MSTFIDATKIDQYKKIVVLDLALFYLTQDKEIQLNLTFSQKEKIGLLQDVLRKKSDFKDFIPEIMKWEKDIPALSKICEKLRFNVAQLINMSEEVFLEEYNKYVREEAQAFVSTILQRRINLETETIIKALLIEYTLPLKSENTHFSLEKLIKFLKSLRKEIKLTNRTTRRTDYIVETLIQEVENLQDFTDSGSSLIINNPIGEGIINKNWPSFLTKEGIKILLNKPQLFTNPAVENFTGLTIELLNKIDFSKDIELVYLHGGAENPFGHAMLKLGEHGYLHINELYGQPQYLSDQAHFSAYQKMQGGRPMDNQSFELPFPEEVKKLLFKFSRKKYLWKGTHGNCLSFAHSILLAGGVPPEELGYLNNHIHSPAKLPRVFNNQRKQPKKNIDSFFPIKESPIYKLYLEKIRYEFPFLFEKSKKNIHEHQEKIFGYYAYLRCLGLQKHDALYFMTEVYDLKPSPNIKNLFFKVKTSTNPLKYLGDTTQAIHGVMDRWVKNKFVKDQSLPPSPPNHIIPIFNNLSRKAKDKNRFTSTKTLNKPLITHENEKFTYR